MPNLQAPGAAVPTTVLLPVDAAHLDRECDFALGCECADPALQIERWGDEASAPLSASPEKH